MAIGIGNRQAVIKKNIGGGQWRPKGESSNTAYAKGFGQSPAPQPQQQASGPMPWDVAAANQEAGALAKRNNTLTGLNAGWGRTQQEYGLEGPWADYASNPFSRAALLQRSYDNAKRGTLNGAGNQLYAGSYVNSQNQNTHQFSLGRNELQNAYANAQAEYISKQQEAENAYNESLAEAAWNRVNAGLQSQPEPMPAAPGPTPPAPGQQPANRRRQQIRQNISQRRKA